MISWSKMKKILESNIADSLKGRIRYFVTRYSKAHDEAGCVRIYFDYTEIVSSDAYKRYDELYKAYRNKSGNNLLEAIKNKGFDQYDFYNAFYIYNNSDVHECLEHENPLVRILAIFDKRIGKITLEKVAENLENQLEWVRVCFEIRLKSEKVI